MKRVADFIHHLFVPKPENNFRARALHNDFLTGYLLMALFLVFFSKNTGYLRNVLGFATDITINKLYQLTNEQRTENNLSPLSYNEKLAQAAEMKAKDMFQKNYWSHYSPDGTTPWSFILAANYHYDYAGENLAKNFLFSKDVVTAWMNSPSHRENIVRKDYTEIGMAVVNGVLNGEETTLVVQMFGKPSSGIVNLGEPKTVAASEISGNNQQPQVLAQNSGKTQINFAHLSFDFVYVFIFFLLVVLITDFYIAGKMNIIRITGKNIAHFIFLGFIFAGLVLFFTKGSIL
jgi:hypothetical protein